MIMEKTLTKRIQGISSLIGNTPLLAIEFEYKGTRRTEFMLKLNI